MATITAPIWKDTYYTTTAASANYSIKLDGNTIFTGKAVRYPGADEMNININRICRNYLECDIAALLETMPSLHPAHPGDPSSPDGSPLPQPPSATSPRPSRFIS